MKTLVTYCSATGNTERLAFAIFDEITGEKSLLKLTELNSVNEYDLVFIGFPIYNFGPAPLAAEFLKSNAKEKSIALFTTMSLKAAPESDQARELYDTTIRNCRECSRDANLLGIFDCPGELSEDVASALLQSTNPLLQSFGSMRSYTIGYPNEENISNARLFAKNIYIDFTNKLRSTNQKLLFPRIPQI